MLRLLVSAFQLNTGTVLTCSRWILNLEKQKCAWSKTQHKYFSYTHSHACTILSVAPSRHSHTQADNSVSQGALSLTPLAPSRQRKQLDRDPRLPPTHFPWGALRRRVPLRLGEWPAELPRLSLRMCCYVPVSRKVWGSRTNKCAAVKHVVSLMNKMMSQGAKFVLSPSSYSLL